MRRGLGSLLAAVLLVAAALALPGAHAESKRNPLPTLPRELPLQPAPGSPAAVRPSPPSGSAGDLVAAWAALVGLGATSVVMLLLGLLAAKRSRTAKARKAPRKTFDAGRQRGRTLRPRTTSEALYRLTDARLGEVLEAVPTPAGARVMVQRPRNHPCEEVAGFLTGLFESAWASDVRVEHERCAGRSGPCRYFVSRSDSPVVNVSASRTAEARTPGWSAGRRRSPPARSGGG